MRTKYSIILPIAAILSGVVLELNATGIAGNFIPNDILLKLWPALLVFAGFDLLFTQRRLIGSLVVFFFAAALLSTQFLDGGWNNEIWKFFLKVWPILLILFGIDWIFSGRNLFNAAVIIAGVIVLVYLLFTVLDVPVLKQLPFELDLRSIIPTSTFSGIIPGSQGTEPWNNTRPGPAQSAPQPEQPVTSPSGGQINIPVPPQSEAVLELNAASGKVSLKAGAPTSQLISGTIDLDGAEKLTQNASLTGQSAEYYLLSSGNASSSDRSDWNLALSSDRTLRLNAIMNNGYLKADLRSMNLSGVNLENKYGPIDIMVPKTTGAPIQIKASNGDIRIYIPKGTAINCYISGAGSVDYPQYNYNWSGSVLSPMRPAMNMINVEVISNNGQVRIIESE